MFQVISIIVVLFIIPGWITVSNGVQVEQAVPCNKACVHGGCVITLDPTCSGPGSGFKQTCNCPPSYTGEFCENFLIKVECDKLCQNGGRCVVNFKDDGCTTAYSTCVCPEYYYGDLCDTFKIDPICDPPCTAGQGECVVLRNSQLAPHLTDKASCNCSMSTTGYYYGNQCQHYQQKGTCDPPCQNGGECTFRGKCDCPQESASDSFYPFYGSNSDCSEYDPVCNPACQNGGTCFHGSCKCISTDQGYYNGPACEQFNVCNPACQNGGTCYNGFCSCKSTDQGYYNGPACEQFIDNAVVVNCSPACESHSVCQDGFCQCKPSAAQYMYGWSCSAVTDCVGTCLNGGTCRYGGKCRCLMEYTGVNCETYIGCLCQNGGRCIDGWCRCVSNETGLFYGTLCENFNFIYPRYPSVLNGGLYYVSAGRILCPYDDIGYFHGDQCDKYSIKDCGGCSEGAVCAAGGCRCPYNLAERSFTYTNQYGRCKGTQYI